MGKFHIKKKKKVYSYFFHIAFVIQYTRLIIFVNYNGIIKTGNLTKLDSSLKHLKYLWNKTLLNIQNNQKEKLYKYSTGLHKHN